MRVACISNCVYTPNTSVSQFRVGLLFNKMVNIDVQFCGVAHLKLTKGILFKPDSTVLEAMVTIAQKVGMDESRAVLAQKYTIYIPGSHGGGTYVINPQQLLSFYSLRSGAEIILTPVPNSITVISVDGQSIELRVDFQLPVSHVIANACNEFGYRMPENYEMHMVEKQNTSLLDPELSLSEQGIDSSNTILALKEKKSMKGKFNKIFNPAAAKKGEKEATTGKKSSLTPGTSLNPDVIISEPMFVKTTRNDDEPGTDFEDGDHIFGASVTTALMKDGKRIRKVPAIVSSCVIWVEQNALDCEGIYRLSAKSSDINNWKLKLDSNIVEPVFPQETDPHIVCNILKLYLRELPEPILTFRMYDVFLGLIADDAEADLTPLLKGLAAPNFNLLATLVGHLIKVQEHQVKNKMTIDNLARVFGPNMLRRPDSEDDVMAIVNDFPKINSLMGNLITHGPKYFSEYLKANPLTVMPTTPKKPIANAPPNHALNMAGIKEELEARSLMQSGDSQSLLSPSRSSLKIIKDKGLSPPPAPPSDNKAAGRAYDIKGYVRAEYEYTAQTEKEIDLKEGDIIAVLIMDSSGWWKGEVNGRRGFFPVTFCSDIAGSAKELEVNDLEQVPVDRDKSLSALEAALESPKSSDAHTAVDSVRITALEAKVTALLEEVASLRQELDAEKKGRKHFEDKISRRLKKSSKITASDK